VRLKSHGYRDQATLRNYQLMNHLDQREFVRSTNFWSFTSRMHGTQYPTVIRFKETNTRCSILIPPSPMIHSGAGLPPTLGLSFKRSTTRAREKCPPTYREPLDLSAHFPYEVLNFERVVLYVYLDRG
jgi:hypothetical protein